MFNRRCHTAGVPVAVCDITGSSVLNHLYLMDVVNCAALLCVECPFLFPLS